MVRFAKRWALRFTERIETLALEKRLAHDARPNEFIPSKAGEQRRSQ
jgi:hypothetical protein